MPLFRALLFAISLLAPGFAQAQDVAPDAPALDLTPVYVQPEGSRKLPTKARTGDGGGTLALVIVTFATGAIVGILAKDQIVKTVREQGE